MNIFWTVFAQDDLNAIFDYIVVEDQDAAIRLVRNIRTKVDALTEYPYMGKIGRVSGTRELLVDRKYYIIYRVIDDNIHILNIIHNSRKYPPE